MVDPAALGTAILGLDAVRRTQAMHDQPARGRPRPSRLQYPRGRFAQMRAVVAGALRSRLARGVTPASAKG